MCPLFVILNVQSAVKNLVHIHGYGCAMSPGFFLPSVV